MTLIISFHFNYYHDSHPTPSLKRRIHTSCCFGKNAKTLADLEMGAQPVPFELYSCIYKLHKNGPENVSFRYLFVCLLCDYFVCLCYSCFFVLDFFFSFSFVDFCCCLSLMSQYCSLPPCIATSWWVGNNLVSYWQSIPVQNFGCFIVLKS